MTNKEAIEYLEKLYMQAEITDVYGDIDDTEPYDTAVDMSIKALEQPEVIYCKDCKWKQGSECVRFSDVRPFADDFCSRAERRTVE